MMFISPTTPMMRRRAPMPLSSSPNGTLSAPSIFGKLAAAMQAKTLVDLRNVYRPEDVTSQGFAYFSIGRPAFSTGAKTGGPMKYLITGSAGFIGFHLCPAPARRRPSGDGL